MRACRSLFLAAIPFFLAPAAPALAQGECALKAMGHMDMYYDVGGRPMVRASLNDVEKYLILDTGGVYGMLDRAIIEDLNLDTRRANVTITGIAGDRSNEFVTLERFQMGNIWSAGRTFMVSPGDNGESSDIRPVGVIAPDVLAAYDADFDFAAGSFNLFSQDHCEGMVVYWLPRVVAVVPFEVDSSFHVRFPVTLDGVELRALLDTGASITVLNADVARRRLGIERDDAGSQQVGAIGEGGDREIYRRQFESLQMEGIAVPAPVIHIYPDLMRTGLGRVLRFSDGRGLPDMIIGMNVLSKLHLYIAYGERRLYITRAADPAP